jgi:hypothetical protein
MQSITLHSPAVRGLILTLFSFFITFSLPNTTSGQIFTESLHLPLIQGHRPPPTPTVFGGEIIGGSDTQVAPLSGDAGITWARYNELEWAKVEATPGVRDWSALASMETALAARSAAGLTNLVIVGEAPVWARQDPSRDCSLIKADALDDFASFMAEVATRYSRPPYYVNHFEIYNEPDVDPDLATPTQNFGCWGDENDPNYGGGYFSQMLSTIYPSIKAANPNAQVVIGGLLLNCDPTHTYPEGRDCSASKFLRGILQAGNGANFDAIAYHGYPIHTLARVDWDRNMYLWAHRGGTVLGKLQFIREELAAFNLDKPIMLTESALICYEGASCNLDQTLLRQDQANYVVRLYSRAFANDLTAAIWYSVNDPGWRYVGLLESDLSPRPAYHALTFLSQQLRNASFVETLGNGNNAVEGYAFRTNTHDIYIYWSNDATSHSVPFPAGALLYDKLGNPIPPPITGSLLVGFEPVYVVLP